MQKKKIERKFFDPMEVNTSSKHVTVGKEKISVEDFFKVPEKIPIMKHAKGPDSTHRLRYVESKFGGVSIELPDIKPHYNDYPFDKTPHLAMFIVGKSGCGKSSILLSVIMKVRDISNLIVCTLISGNPVNELISQHCKQNGITYTEINEIDNAMDQMTDIVENGKKPKDKPYTLIIFDDWNANTTKRDDPYTKMKNEVFSKWRNKKCSIIEVVQSYTMISTLLRTNITAFIMFPMNDKYAIQNARKDVINMMDITEDEFTDWYKKIIQKDHSFIMGVKDRAYISLQDVKNGEIQEYKFNRHESDSDDEEDVINLGRIIANDRIIKHVINEFSKNGVNDHDAAKLKKHLKNLSKEYRVPIDDIMEEIGEQYNIEIEME